MTNSTSSADKQWLVSLETSSIKTSHAWLEGELPQKLEAMYMMTEIPAPWLKQAARCGTLTA